MAYDRKEYDENTSSTIYTSAHGDGEGPRYAGRVQEHKLRVGSKLQDALGKEGTDKIGKDLGSKGTRVSTGGGDPFKKGSTNNKFLVAKDKEHAEQLREKNPGVDVRVEQERDEDGQFASNDGEDRAQHDYQEKLRKKIDEDEDYLQKVTGKSDEEWNNMLQSLGMNKEQFVQTVYDNIQTALDKVDLSSIDQNVARRKEHKQEKADTQEAQKMGVSLNNYKKIMSMPQTNEKEINSRNGSIKLYQILEQTRQYKNSTEYVNRQAFARAKRQANMDKIHQKYGIGKYAQNEQLNQQDKNQDSFEKAKGKADLSKYSQQEINEAKEFIKSEWKINDENPAGTLIEQAIKTIRSMR